MRAGPFVLTVALAACGPAGGPGPPGGPVPPTAPAGPSAPAQAPSGALFVTTHGDSVLVPQLLTIPVGGSAYHQARVVLAPGSPPLGIVIGQPEAWCGPVAQVVGILENIEKHAAGLAPADAFTSWYPTACGLQALLLEEPGAYDLWTVIDGHQVGTSALRWQFDAVGGERGEVLVELRVGP